MIRCHGRKSYNNLLRELHSIDSGLRSQISALQKSIEISDGTNVHEDQHNVTSLQALQQLQGSIVQAASAVFSVTTNQHFDIPQPVSSIYTGRKSSLDHLKSYFIPPKQPITASSRNGLLSMAWAAPGKPSFVANLPKITAIGKTVFCFVNDWQVLIL